MGGGRGWEAGRTRLREVVSRRSAKDPWRYGVRPEAGDMWWRVASWSVEVETAGGTAFAEGLAGDEWNITR